MPTIDPTLQQDYDAINQERDATHEAKRQAEAHTPDHRKVWKTTDVEHIVLPKAAPLNEAKAKTALAQAGVQMQAEVPAEKTHKWAAPNSNLFNNEWNGHGYN